MKRNTVAKQYKKKGLPTDGIITAESIKKSPYYPYRPTFQSIAEVFGVNKSTVSKAMSGIIKSDLSLEIRKFVDSLNQGERNA